MVFFENSVIFDKFQITEKIGDGPVFSVYIGKNINTSAKVLIKILNQERFTRYEVDKICFNNEIALIRTFDNSNILKVIDAGSYSNTVCIVSEYEDYTTLSDYLKGRGALDISASLDIIHQLALALRYAHGRNVLHRGIRTGSILLCGDTSAPTVKLFDFALSYIVDNSSVSSDEVDESFGFMAPESTGLLDRKVDLRSDLYSLGILLYRLVTGNYPFHADTIDNMVYQHVAVMPKDPTAFNPSVPEEVSKIIMKLLTKDPDQRYQSANELINDIDMFELSSNSDIHMHDEDVLRTMDQRSRLLTRKHELAQLRNYYTKALEGPGRFCLVRGSLGCGKSDLFANLCNELSASNIPFYRAHFSAQGTMTPYQAFHDILSNFVVAFNEYDRKLQMTERNRLARTLTGLSDLVFRINPDMKRVLPESLSLPALEGYREQQRSVMLLASFFLALHTSGQPFVIILDDIHYADAASLSLLLEMSNIIRDYKVFVVCSCRSTDIPDNNYLTSFLERFKNDELFTNIALEPFDENRMGEFLADLLILDRSECQLLSSYVAEKTGGNPYFAVNVVRSMLEDNVISVSNGSLEQNWDQLRTISQTINVFQLITKRMERLSEDEITLLEIASVIGDEFSVKMLGIVTDLTMRELTSMLGSAVSLQFIEFSSTADCYQFSHRDIHSAFLERIDEARLKSLHYWIAKAIEVQPDDVSKNIYKLVYHFTASGSDSDLRRYIIEAASLARYSNANDEALKYYYKALELLEREGHFDGDEWISCKKALVELNLIVGHFSDAITAANDLLAVIKDVTDKASILRQVALGYYRQSNFAKCEELLLEALNYLGESFPEDELRRKLHYKAMRFHRKVNSKLVADPTSRDRKAATDEKASHIVFSIYETLCWVFAYSDITKFDYLVMRMYSYAYKHFGSSIELASALSALSLYHLIHSQLKSGDESAMLSLKLRKSLNDEYGIARSYFISGLSHQLKSEVDRSIKDFKEAAECFSAIGDMWELNNVNIFLSTSYLMIGDYETCKALCLKCVELSEKLNDSFSTCTAYTNLLTCYCESGSYSDAEEIARRTRPIVESLNFPYAIAQFNLAYGKLLLEQQKYTDALGVFEITLNLVEDNNLCTEFLGSVYGYLAITKTRVLDRDRTTLSLNEIQGREFAINELCEKASKISKHSPVHQLLAYRSEALFGILTEKFKRTDEAYQTGAKISADCQYHYEVGVLDYEYGQYLLSKHRNTEARFFIFEAYMTFSNISSASHSKKCERIIAEKYKEDFHNNSIISDVAAHQNRLNVDRRVNTLLRLGERLTSTLELEDLQRKILQDAVELVGAERGILFLYPETGEKHLYVASVYNLGSFDCNTYDWMLEKVEQNRKPIIINDVQSDEYRKHYAVMARYSIKSVMAMPMFVRGNLFGVIYLDSRLVRQIFTDDYIEAMGFIANQAGAPIENARLYHRAITDGLTGIYGRSYLDNLVVDKTDNPAIKLSAIMIDVDNFKRFNDTYGHPFGDKVLKQIAGIMKRVSGDLGTPCRYGGEEFVVLLDTNDVKLATEVAEKIRQTVENTSLACNDGTDVTLVSITISLGVSIWDPTSMERIDLIEHADKALYYAKGHGKNQVVVWTPELN